MREKRFFQSGWIVLGVSFITLALVYGVWYAFSVFFVALLRDFGWSRSVGAGAFSVCMVMSSAISPVVGGMVYSVGPKRVIILGTLTLGVGLALCGMMRSWWQFYLFFSLVVGAGIGAAGWVPNVILVQEWFKEKRGLATGIISSGIGIGILVCVPSIQYLIIKWGWRIAYGVLAFVLPLIIISLALAFLRRPPEVGGPQSSEVKGSSSSHKDPLVVHEEWASRHWTLPVAVRTKEFWLLGISFFLGNLITQAVFAHQVAYFVDQGMSALSASYIVGLIGVVSLGGKILWGALSDRLGREVVYSMGIACSVLSMILLISFSTFPLTAIMYLFSLFFALGYAVAATHPPLITADIFGGKAFGKIFGFFMIFIGAGGAFGAWFVGLIFDLTGNYTFAFLFLILCALTAGVNIWWAAPRKIRKVPGRVESLRGGPSK